MPEEHEGQEELTEQSVRDQTSQDQPIQEQPAQEQPVSEPQVQDRQVDTGLEAARELGLDGEWEDSAAVIRDLASRLKDSQPYIDYARRVLPYDQQISELISGQKQEEPEQQAEEWDASKHFKEAWGAPEYDSAWDAFVQSGMVTLDPATGQFVAADGYQTSVPLNVIQGLNEHRNWQRQGLERLLSDPYGSTWEAFQEPLERLIKERIESYVSSLAEQDAVSEWEAAHAKDLYEYNGDEPVRDIYGNIRTTPYGEAFYQTCQELRDSGMTDPRKVIQMAIRLHPPPSNGSSEPEAPAEKESSFLDKAMDKARHSPSSGGYSENRDIEPIVQSTMDLERMFVDEARKAGLVGS